MNLENFENLLIFGARGNTAYNFLKILEKEKFNKEISIVSRDKTKNDYFRKFNLKLNILNGDIKDKIFLEKCFHNIDTVINLANMENSPNIVYFGSIKKVKWFILVHSTMIYSNYKSKFILNRIKIERDILKNNKNVTILRPTMIYGNNRDINISKLIKFLDNYRFFPIFGDGKNLLQPIYIQDLSKAYFDVIKNKNKTFNKSYNLAGKNNIEYLRMLKLIESQLEKKMFFFKIPINLSIVLVNFFNLFLFGKFPINQSQVKRQSEDKTFDTTNAEIDFNFTSRLFEEGLKLQIREYNKSKKQLI